MIVAVAVLVALLVLVGPAAVAPHRRRRHDDLREAHELRALDPQDDDTFRLNTPQGHAHIADCEAELADPDPGGPPIRIRSFEPPPRAGLAAHFRRQRAARHARAVNNHRVQQQRLQARRAPRQVRTRRVRTAAARTSPTSTADPAPAAGGAAAASPTGGAS